MIKVAQMKPLIQGNLDAFCGAYSVINSLNIVYKRIGLKESCKLFSEIVESMENRKKISNLAIDGLSDRDMGFVYREIIRKRYPVKTYKPFHKKPDIDLGSYWDQIVKFLEEDNRAVNLAVDSWDWGHWTVVYKATPKSLHLWDSGTRQRFNRRNCTTKELSAHRNLLLWPTTTRFLFRAE